MSKKTFTEKEIKLLSKNPYIQSVSSKSITYTEEFKQLFITEYDKGLFSREIKRYMTYYNHYRYQWKLNKMTPVQYRDHLIQAA